LAASHPSFSDKERRIDSNLVSDVADLCTGYDEVKFLKVAKDNDHVTFRSCTIIINILHNHDIKYTTFVLTNIFTSEIKSKQIRY
jgi:hypothetical protein